MIDGIKLEPGERVVLQSPRGGTAGYGGLMWLLILFGGSHVCGALMIIPLLVSDDSKRADGTTTMMISSIVSLLVGGAALVRWLLLRRQPSYFITDRRLIARRLFWTPVVIDLDNVASAARFMVKYTRYGRVVNEVLTHRVAVAFHSGGYRRLGPIKYPDEFTALLQSVAHRIVDCRALPDVSGGLSAAEARTDVFFAQTTLTGGAPRGPLFVGPTKVIGFSEVFFTTRLYQVLTIVGASRSPEEIEQSVVALAQNSEFGRGRAVIMDREGLDLSVVGGQLLLTSGDKKVAFDLAPPDAERAAKYAKRGQTHVYR